LRPCPTKQRHREIKVRRNLDVVASGERRICFVRDFELKVGGDEADSSWLPLLRMTAVTGAKRRSVRFPSARWLTIRVIVKPEIRNR
jgi:hypothetical protein